MTDKMMDDLFRDKLERHASEVPQGAFERIMAARERKRRRPAGYWYLLPAAALIGGGIFFGARHQGRTEAPQLEKAVTRQDGSAAPAAKTLPPVAASDDASGRSAEQNASLTKPTANEKTYTLSGSNANPQQQSSAGSKGSLATDHRTHVSHAAQPGDRDRTDLRDIDEPQASQQGASAPTLLTNLSFPSLRTALNQGKDPLVPYKPDMASTQRFCIPPCGIPGCPDFREYRNDWYIEAFGSADMPFKSTQEKLDKSGFLPHKDSTEHMLLSYSAGLRVSRNLTNNLLLKTGFHYSQINERFDYRNESEKKIVTVITIRTVIRGPGDTLLVRDTSQVETVGVRVKRTYNKYRNIDIPLLLSWELRKPDFTIGLNGGLLFNIRSTFQGDMLDTTLVPMSQTARSPSSQIRTNWGLGLYAGVSFVKPVGQNLDVFAEPWYRVYLRNVATDDAPFQQKMSAWGLQLGVRYRFNNGGQRY